MAVDRCPRQKEDDEDKCDLNGCDKAGLSLSVDEVISERMVIAAIRDAMDVRNSEVGQANHSAD